LARVFITNIHIFPYIYITLLDNISGIWGFGDIRFGDRGILDIVV
jgi:hypothetical protein